MIQVATGCHTLCWSGFRGRTATLKMAQSASWSQLTRLCTKEFDAKCEGKTWQDATWIHLAETGLLMPTVIIDVQQWILQSASHFLQLKCCCSACLRWNEFCTPIQVQAPQIMRLQQPYVGSARSRASRHFLKLASRCSMSSRFKRSRPGSSSFFFALSDLVLGLGLRKRSLVKEKKKRENKRMRKTNICEKEDKTLSESCGWWVCKASLDWESTAHEFTLSVQFSALWAQHAPDCRQTLHIFQVHSGIFGFSWWQVRERHAIDNQSAYRIFFKWPDLSRAFPLLPF